MQAEKIEQIHRLWDELAAFPAVDMGQALTHFQETVCSLINSTDSYWLGGLRLSDRGQHDPAQGWRPRQIVRLVDTEGRKLARVERFRRLELGNPDISVYANLCGPEQFKITSLHEVIEPEWFDSDYYKLLFEPFGVLDVLYVTVRLGPFAESWFAFERSDRDAPRFNDEDRALLEYCTRPMNWFHRRIALHQGMMMIKDPLTAAEKRVMGQLLSGKTEVQIGEELNLTRSTVHTYSVRICKKLGVRGRTGLTALWLGSAEGTIW